MFSKVYSTTNFGLESHIVSVEIDTGRGLPSFEMTGGLSGEIKEAKERIRVAIKNSGYELKPQRISVNISPAQLHKEGTGFDLPIAIGILISNGILTPIEDYNLEGDLFVGELSLDGTINHVNGILPAVIAAKESGIKRCFVPFDNMLEASVIKGIEVYGVISLSELVDALQGEGALSVGNCDDTNNALIDTYDVDYSDIRGQIAAKKATMVAAAGMHNIIYVGSPGSGKTMLAKRIPTIMPSLSFEDKLELTKVYSVAGLLNSKQPIMNHRPFRQPYHNVTMAAMYGGGRFPMPGEITLSRKGVLFMDEMTEYNINILEGLRQPLEDKNVTIVRLGYAYTYPADCMLAAAINPCKCGYYPDRNRCSCTENDIRRYMGKISKPLWDRFDICVNVTRVEMEDMMDEGINNAIHEQSEKYLVNNFIYDSISMKEAVEQAVEIQKVRFKGKKIAFNSEMTSRDIGKYCNLGKDEQDILKEVYEKLSLTARGYHKILRVARTIADIYGEDKINVGHICEAVSYRSISGE